MAIDLVNAFSLLEEVCFYLTGITVHIHHPGIGTMLILLLCAIIQIRVIFDPLVTLQNIMLDQSLDDIRLIN